MSKPYDPDCDLFDMSTWYGRALHTTKLLNPFNLLHSEKKINEYKDHIYTFVHDKNKKFSDEEYWNMDYVIKSSCHPETEKLLFLPCRWAAYVPVNIPVMFGLAV